MLEDILTWQGEPRYAELWANSMFNQRKPPNYPDVIASVQSTQDVVDCIDLARRRGLRVAVRAGGHSWCSSPLRHGGLLLDISGLDQLRISPTLSEATVQPGVSSRQLAHTLAKHHLSFPTGHCSTVGMSGFILSGGIGWNSGVFGPASTNLLELEVVTADGKFRTCNAYENSELFWAARGAGPGYFAVATSFKVRLYPLPAVATTQYIFPSRDLDQVAQWVDHCAASAAPGVELIVLLSKAAQDLPGIPSGDDIVTVLAIAFAESPATALRNLEIFRFCPVASGRVNASVDIAASIEALYDGSDFLWPTNHRYVADTMWTDKNFSTILPKLSRVTRRAPSGKSFVLVTGSPAGTLDPNTAFSPMGKNFVAAYGVWEEPKDDLINQQWGTSVFKAIESDTTGHYIAEADLSADREHTVRSYKPENWTRLLALKRKFDPDDLIHTYPFPH